MTNRMLTSARSLAVLAAISMGFRRAPAGPAVAPEPLCRPLLDEAGDRWMFGEPDSAMSSEAYLCRAEMSRVSGALTGLRSLLTQITRHGVLTDGLAIAAPMTPLRADNLLFDGEYTPHDADVLPFEDADLFIEGAIAQSRWPVVREEMSRVA